MEILRKQFISKSNKELAYLEPAKEVGEGKG